MLQTREPVGLAALLVLTASIATLAGAWGFQLIGGLAPCPMCLTQRLAYYSAIPLSLLVIVLLRVSGAASTWARAVLGLCALAILAGGAYAVYHAGVEWKWWKGPETCTGTGTTGSTDSPLPDLTKPPVVPCDEAPWRLFGISLAGYNVLISAALVLACIWGIVRQPAEDRN